MAFKLVSRRLQQRVRGLVRPVESYLFVNVSQFCVCGRQFTVQVGSWSIDKKSEVPRFFHTFSPRGAFRTDSLFLPSLALRRVRRRLAGRSLALGRVAGLVAAAVEPELEAGRGREPSSRQG